MVVQEAALANEAETAGQPADPKVISARGVEPARASALLAAMIGEYVWWSRIGEDAILRMDFRAPRLRIREPSPDAGRCEGEVRRVLERRIVIPTGGWHLFIEGGAWDVAAGGLACSRAEAERSDPARQVHFVRCLSSLDGQKLASFEWSAEDAAWQLGFDLGGSVSIRNAGDLSAADDVWNLFVEGGQTLSGVADGSFTFGEAVRT